MKKVDARGFACPMPVVMVQKEVKASAPAELEVLVDDKCGGFGKKKNPASIENQLLAGFCRTRSRDRTGTDCSTGV